MWGIIQIERSDISGMDLWTDVIYIRKWCVCVKNPVQEVLKLKEDRKQIHKLPVKYEFTHD